MEDDPFIQKLRRHEAEASAKIRALGDRRARIIAAEVKRTRSVADVARRMGVSTMAVRKYLERIGAPPPSRPWLKEVRRANQARREASRS